MLNNLKKRKEEGFTIIEVMIVLAIAGLIILVVLLAIPALQRNSRNTTMKNDASAVAGAINEFHGANNGKVPTSVTANNGTITVSGGANTTQVTGKVQGGTTVTTGGSASTTISAITVVLGFKCADQAVGAASSRAAAVTYVVETTSAVAPQCLES